MQNFSGTMDARRESVQELVLEILIRPNNPPTFHNRAVAQTNILFDLTREQYRSKHLSAQIEDRQVQRKSEPSTEESPW